MLPAFIARQNMPVSIIIIISALSMWKPKNQMNTKLKISRLKLWNLLSYVIIYGTSILQLPSLTHV